MENAWLIILGAGLSIAGGFFGHAFSHMFAVRRERQQREYQEKQSVIERQIDRLEKAREEVREAVAELRGLQVQLEDNDMTVPNEAWRYQQASAMARLDSALVWINDPEIRHLRAKHRVSFWIEREDDRIRSFDFGTFINGFVRPAERRIAELLAEYYQL